MDKNKTLYEIDAALSNLFIASLNIRKIGRESNLVFESQLDNITVEILQAGERLAKIADDIESE